MRKFVRTYSPFLVYFVCVALAYFLCFYLFPKYNAALAYLGFLIIYTYIDIGVFILGFFNTENVVFWKVELTMKKKLSFIIEIIIGIIFICFGYFVIDTDYYATLFYAMGFGLAFASGVQLLKICYYEMPKNKEKLQNINRENHINNVDERKIFLRMKAGSLVYQLMTFVYLFVAFVLALLHIEAWIIGIIFGLFLLQTFLGIILYKHFEKHF